MKKFTVVLMNQSAYVCLICLSRRGGEWERDAIDENEGEMLSTGVRAICYRREWERDAIGESESEMLSERVRARCYRREWERDTIGKSGSDMLSERVRARCYRREWEGDAIGESESEILSAKVKARYYRREWERYIIGEKKRDAIGKSESEILSERVRAIYHWREKARWYWREWERDTIGESDSDMISTRMRVKWHRQEWERCYRIEWEWYAVCRWECDQDAVGESESEKLCYFNIRLVKVSGHQYRSCCSVTRYAIPHMYNSEEIWISVQFGVSPSISELMVVTRYGSAVVKNEINLDGTSHKLIHYLEHCRKLIRCPRFLWRTNWTVSTPRSQPPPPRRRSRAAKIRIP